MKVTEKYTSYIVFNEVNLKIITNKGATNFYMTKDPTQIQLNEYKNLTISDDSKDIWNKLSKKKSGILFW